MDLAVDLRARTIVVRGPGEWMEIAEQVLSELDQPPELVHTQVVPLAQTPAEELAQRLQHLLRRTTPEGK
jgi:type II secretory pathway component GspD/PulD (secretin)